MSSKKRGAVRDVVKYTQLKDYTKMCYGTITPTDIDGSMDFGPNVFVFLELKHEGKDLPRGQELHLERLCDALYRGGNHSLAVVATHGCGSTEMIPVHECSVERFRYMLEWNRPGRACTCKELVDRFHARTKEWAEVAAE